MDGAEDWAFVGRLRLRDEQRVAAAFLIAPHIALTSTRAVAAARTGAQGRVVVELPRWPGSRGKFRARVGIQSAEYGVAVLELERRVAGAVALPEMATTAVGAGRWTSCWFGPSCPKGAGVAGGFLPVGRDAAEGLSKRLLARIETCPADLDVCSGAPLVVDGAVHGVFLANGAGGAAATDAVVVAESLPDFLASETGRRLRDLVEQDGAFATEIELPGATTTARRVRCPPTPSPDAAAVAPAPRRRAGRRVRVPTGEWESPGAATTSPETKRPDIIAQAAAAAPALGAAATPAATEGEELARRPREGCVVEVAAYELVSVFESTGCHVETFLIDRTPVTRGEYAEFIRATGWLPPPSWRGVEPPTGTAALPVGDVRLRDARTYAAWRGLRLPTHLEWEAALRAPDGRRFPWGDVWDPQRCHGPERAAGGAAPVGSYPGGAAPCGCLGLVGNVWEWTELDPRGRAPESSDHTWVFGGSYRHGCVQQGRAARSSVQIDHGYDYLGFRCASDVAASRHACVPALRDDMPAELQFFR